MMLSNITKSTTETDLWRINFERENSFLDRPNFLLEIGLELLSASFTHFWISVTPQSIDFSLESSLFINKNRST
jgi:hypothetical protein